MTKETLKKKPIMILILGSLPPPLGGTTVALKQLVDNLSANREVDVRVINTSGFRGKRLRGIFRFVQTGFRLIMSAFQVDVVTFHSSPAGISFFGPVILVVSRLSRKPLLIRKFNGLHYMELGLLKGKIAHFVVRYADLYLAETKRIVRVAQEIGIKHVHWFPNSRPMSRATRSTNSVSVQCMNFVFIGHVNESKGIREIIAIDKLLPNRVKIDVFGPLTGNIREKDFEHCKSVHYKGILEPDKVIQTLAEYDALLLPTYYSGEGYPGVIIEAYSSGIPVICTRWRDIPEIVDESSGILISPKDANALLEAVQRLAEDKEMYLRLSKGVKENRMQFSSEFWNERFVKYCRELANKPDRV